jgi:beta-aspartyl-dipeptidase (metallo-type)
MEILLRNGHVFSPQYAGVNDILIEDGIITCIRPKISVSAFVCAREIDVSGMFVMPGLIDTHVHIIGGGGETGDGSLIAPLEAASLIQNGITGCVGMLGYERRRKTPQMLFEKAAQFNEAGVETYALTGSYQLPPATLTGSLTEDLETLELCMGAGEIAIEDSRVQGFAMEQIILLLQTVHKAAKKTQKPLKAVFHIGDKAKDLSLLFRMVKIYPQTAEIAIPTHVNRSAQVLEEAAKYIQMGGTVDITAGITPKEAEEGFIPAPQALAFLLDKTGGLDNVTLSSDAGGSIPVFDEKGAIVSCGTADASALLLDMQAAYRKGMKLSELLKAAAVNPAVIYGLSQGIIFEGARACINITDDDLQRTYTIVDGTVYG